MINPMPSKFFWIKKLPVLLGFAALFLTIPLTVFLTLQRQEIRKEAAPGTSLELIAPVKVKAGESFKVDIRLNTGDPTVPTTGTDIILKYVFTPLGEYTLSKEPASETQIGIANPASVYCEKIGGKLEIRTDPDDSQYGMCLFPDGTECEEWALYRNECQPPVSSLFVVQEIIPGNLYDSYLIQEASSPVSHEPKDQWVSAEIEGTIKISGSASSLADYFVGEGVFATVKFMAKSPGHLALNFVWTGEDSTEDSNIVGLVNGQPKERLTSAPVGAGLDVVTGGSNLVKDCGQPCGPNQPCPSGLLCGTPCPTGQICAQVLICYARDCPFDRNCSCAAVDVTPVPTKSIVPTPLPTPVVSYIPTPTSTPTAPAQLNFDLILSGVRSGFDAEATIYGLEKGDSGTLQLLGSTKTDLSGKGTIDLRQEDIGKNYQLFVRTPSHLRKKTASSLSIHTGNNYVDFGTLTPGDLFVVSGKTEQDNLINNFDVAEVLKQWDMTVAAAPTLPKFLKADLNRDGVVNSWDLKMVFDNFGRGGDGLEETTGGGQFCGGTAGIPCPAGYRCELEGSYPDAGGKCVPMTKPTPSDDYLRRSGEERREIYRPIQE